MKKEQKLTLDGLALSPKDMKEEIKSMYFYGEIEIKNYITMWIINPDNDQKLIEAIIPEAEAPEYEAEKELTITTSYHDWSDTAADKLIEAYEFWTRDEDNVYAMEELEEAKEEIKKYIGQLPAGVLIDDYIENILAE